MKISDPGKSRRRITSLLIMLTFLVMSATGALAFFRPFSIKVVGLHALMGFVFMAFIMVHILNNSRQLRGYLKSPKIWLIIAVIVGLSALFFYQPAPVKAVLGLSQNLGPALDRFEVKEDGMVYQYAPSDDYRMELTVKTGSNFELEGPPKIAIWLENQGDYHIKTLLGPDEISDDLPYWSFKRKGWEKAKEEAQKDDKLMLFRLQLPMVLLIPPIIFYPLIRHFDTLQASY
jgi:hypothetical protein